MTMRGSKPIGDTPDLRLMTDMSEKVNQTPIIKGKKYFPPIFSSFASQTIPKNKFSQFFGRNNKVVPMNDYQFELEASRAHDCYSLPVNKLIGSHYDESPRYADSPGLPPQDDPSARNLKRPMSSTVDVKKKQNRNFDQPLKQIDLSNPLKTNYPPVNES